MQLRRVLVYADRAELHNGAEVDGARFTAFYESEFAGQIRRAAMLTGSTDTTHDVVHDAMVEV